MKRVRIIKLGGSLLTMPDLSKKFHRWCAANPHPLTLVIVGGGEIVEAVRNIDRANPIDESFAHWVCMDLLKHTARLAHRLIANVDLCETVDDLQRVMSGSRANSETPIIAIVQVGICFARNLPNLGLPDRWEVTSDSLAAAFGIFYAAEELVMMKSTDVPQDAFQNGNEFAGLADAGIVDACFPSFAEKISQVRFVNLRSD